MTVQNVRRYKTELRREQYNTTIIFANLCAPIILSSLSRRPGPNIIIILLLFDNRPPPPITRAPLHQYINIYIIKDARVYSLFRVL